MHGLEGILSDIRSRNQASHLWIDCVIKAVFIMMMYIRAERDAYWCLHLTVVKEMLPCFFSAEHVNYAQFGLYYLLLLAYYKGNAKIMSVTIHKRRTCLASCLRALE